MFIPSPTPKRRKRKCDLRRGNGGRHKPTIYEVGYKPHKRGNGYCLWVKGLLGWNPAGNGYPITEDEAIKTSKQIAKETKGAEWVGEL